MDPSGRGVGKFHRREEPWELLREQHQGTDSGLKGHEGVPLKGQCEGDHLHRDIALIRGVSVVP